MSLMNGEPIDWNFVWYFGFPLEFEGYENIAWGVRSDPSDVYQGFFNTLDHPTTTPLCMKN